MATSPKFPVQFWNHHSTIMVDPDYPRTSNLVEGFHRGFKTRVNRARPTVQEYFRAVREEQVTTDFHMDRLAGVLTATCSLFALVLRIIPQLLSICSPLPSTSATP